MLKGECGKKQATEDGVGVNVGVFDAEEAGVVPGGHWHGVGGNGVDDGGGDGDGDGAAWEETRKSTKSTASVATIVAVLGGGGGASGGRMDQSFALGCCFFHRRRRFISMSCAVQEAYSLPVSPLTNSASTTPVPVS